MKTITIILTAVIASILASCTSGSSSTQHDNMPGMSAEEHAKMKH